MSILIDIAGFIDAVGTALKFGFILLLIVFMILWLNTSNRKM